AQKAERYKKYRTEVKDLELHVASHRWLELSGSHSVIKQELDHVSAGAEGVRFALRVREAEVEAERVVAQNAEAKVDGLQSSAYELDNRTKLLESQIEHHEELKKSLSDSEAQMGRELEELAAQRATLGGERDLLGTSLAGLEERERETQSVLQAETTELERRRGAATDAERLLGEARARLADSETRIARAETVLHGFEERREESRVRLEKMRQDAEGLGERLVELEQETQTVHARLEGLSGDKDQTAKHRDQIERELEQLREDIRESDHVVESLRERLTDRRSRLRSLEEVQGRLDGVGAGVRCVVTDFREREPGIVGLLADQVDCPVEWTQALAGVLGDRLQHVVVESDDVALRALQFLRSEERGRATFVARRTGDGIRHEGPTAPGVVGLLSDLVSYADADAGLVRHLLAGVVVVESLEVALELKASVAQGTTFVTRDGDVLAPDGALSGGAGEDTGAHIIDVKREIRELHQLVAQLDAELTVA
ncbi:MAG: hypothetical protein KC416_16145, partial [Myxococcales bacterium]|nr:hypothetical protein [Myxococcales bacterium]